MSKEPTNARADGGSPSPVVLDTVQLLPEGTVQDPYPEKRDRWITMTALAIIGGAALVSAIALLLFPYIFAKCTDDIGCQPSESLAWAAELIKLALVSSLAFVMGTRQS